MWLKATNWGKHWTVTTTNLWLFNAYTHTYILYHFSIFIHFRKLWAHNLYNNSSLDWTSYLQFGICWSYIYLVNLWAYILRKVQKKVIYNYVLVYHNLH